MAKKKSHLKPSDVPAVLHVLGLELPVKLVRNLKQDGDRLDASYNHHNQTIELDTTVEPERLTCTLFHELVHAALARSGQLVYIETIPNLEEAIVMVMETAFGHAIDLTKLTKDVTHGKREDHDLSNVSSSVVRDPSRTGFSGI